MRRVYHPLCLFEAVGQVFVVVDRDYAAVLLEDFYTLFEKLVARVKDLTLFILGIIAVLADDEHGVHGELVAAATQRLGDGGIHRETEFLCALGALIALR